MGKIDGGLRALFKDNLPEFDWCPIESGLTGGGIPDANFCRRGVEGWIEYKRATGWAVPLLPEQVGWIARRCRAGGRVWIAVRQIAPPGPRRAARDALWLVPGALAREAKARGLRGLASAPGVRSWGGGPAAWRWDVVGATLVAF